MQVSNNPEFNGMTDEQVQAFMADNTYILSRKLECGTWIGIVSLAFSFAVCSGVSYTASFELRWCFKRFEDALTFFQGMTNYDDVPNEELQKGLVGHRYFREKPLLVLYNESGHPRW